MIKILIKIKNSDGIGPQTKVSLEFSLLVKYAFNPDDNIASPSLLDEIISIFLVLIILLNYIILLLAHLLV